MKYVATVGDRTFEIEVNADDQITVDGRVHAIDFRSVSGQPVYSLLIDGQSYEACVQPTEAGLEVLLQGRLHVVEVEDEGHRKLREASRGPALHSGEVVLKSPMPGLIMAVLVTDGQAVERGQDLIILESMKMQNVLKAPRAGAVTHVQVRPGDRVEQDQVLLKVG